MLRIRPSQLEAFEIAARADFAARARAHLEALHPEVCAGLDAEGQAEFVAQALRKAQTYGIRAQRDVIVLIDVMALLGRDFDVDEELRPVHDPLTGGGVAPQHRAEELWRRTRAHLEGRDPR